MLVRWILVVSAAIILFFVLKSTVNFEQTRQYLISFPKDKLALLLTISLIISVVKSYRFFWILKDSKVNIDLWSAFKGYLAGGAVSILPGGELFRISLLKKEEKKIHSHQVAGPVLAQAYVEVLSAVLIVIIGSLIFEIFIVPAILSFILVVGLIFLLVHDKPLRSLIKRSIKFKRINKLLNRIKESQELLKKIIFNNSGKRILLKERYLELKKVINDNYGKGSIFRRSWRFVRLQALFQIIKFYNRKLFPSLTFTRSIAISLISHILGGVLLFIIVASLGKGINIFQSIYTYALGVVVSSIGSISPGGLGFTEGAMTAALVFFGVGFTEAVIVVILYRVVTLVFNILLGLIFLTTFYRSILLKH